MAQLLDEFVVDVPNGSSVIGVKLYASTQPRQHQALLRVQDARLQLEAPMVFWADCTLVAHKNKQEIVAVGWAQTMTTTIVEFCYSTPTHGCVAELDLTPSPCADGGYGIWYGGTNTSALQFLGPAYTNHNRDAMFFQMYNQHVLDSDGSAFDLQIDRKRAIMSDSPFIAIPEAARCKVSNPNLPVSLVGAPFSLGHGAPTRTTDNSPLLANAQLECVKASYRFTTYFCALASEDASAVPDLTQAKAFAEIKWAADYGANIIGVVNRKNWQMTGPLKIRDTGARRTQYTRKDGQKINRCPGAPCNHGNRGVVFDYRQLPLFY